MVKLEVPRRVEEARAGPRAAVMRIPDFPTDRPELVEHRSIGPGTGITFVIRGIQGATGQDGTRTSSSYSIATSVGSKRTWP
jgi:hypothetical protein